MNSTTPRSAGLASGRGRNGLRQAAGLWVAMGLLGCGSLPQPAMAEEPAEAKGAAVTPVRALPAARWQGAGCDFAVELSVDPAVGASHFPALGHYAIGVAAMPVTLLQPQIALGLPFYLLLAAPWQAVFNARADGLARVLVAEPLPDAVVRAVRGQWRGPAASASPTLQVTLRLAGYGLMARSGRRLEALESAEDLCLVAEGRLEVSRAGGAPRAEDISIGPRSATRDAPPPLCAAMPRWAEDDARLLRQATGEMAELLAAFMVDRAERQP